MSPPQYAVWCVPPAQVAPDMWQSLRQRPPTQCSPLAQVAVVEQSTVGSQKRVVVLPHLDLLTTSQGGLTTEAREVIPLHPALVIWQTGSADVTRGVPLTDFGNALEQGIVALKEAGSDVLLVDSQFGPRASLLINTDAYRESVRWSARRFDVPLFKRYDTMQYRHCGRSGLNA